MSRVLAFLGCLLVVTAQASDPFSGRERFTQFRNISGLPGGGFGVMPDGTVGINGALAFSTPVAYSLKSGSWVGVGGGMSFDSQLRFPKKDEPINLFNGTAAALMGVTTKYVNFSIGGMVLSTEGDSVLNLAASYRHPGPLTVGVGVQDTFSTGGANGQTIDLAHGGGLSRSIYGVGTYDFQHYGIYASAGIGTQRFRNGFANASMRLLPNTRVFTEYDGWVFSYGIAGEAGPVTGQIGLVDSRYLEWSVAMKF